MNLYPTFTLGSLNLTEYPFAVEFGTDLGNPENAAEVIDSLMQDGEVISSSRSGNRTIVLPVLISDSDMLALADAEAALLAETEKQRNALTVDPGDGVAPPTVFDTFRAQVSFKRDDNEEQSGVRRYVLTIPALPFGGAVDEITTTGVTSAATPTTVVINDASTNTNWTQIPYDGATPSAADSGSGTWVLGSMNAQDNGDGYYTGRGSLIYTPPTAIDMSATQFLQVDWRVSFYGSALSGVTAFSDGVALTQVSSVSLSNGFTRSTFLCSDASVASFRIKSPDNLRSTDGSGGARSGQLVIDQLIRTNQAPTTSTLRQKVTSLEVKGSARTQGSLVLSHPSSSLGYTMVHTYPDLGDGYTPDLSRWISSGGPGTADTSLVSGYYKTWSSSLAFTVPLSMLRPGPYLVVARVRASTAGTYTLGAGGASSKVTFATTGTWQTSTIGVVQIGDHVGGTSFSQAFSCSASGAGGTVDVDEAWLFYVGDDAALTRIQLGTGTPSASGSSSRLWIDTASVQRPYPSLWRGTLADKSDARNAVSDADAWEDHQFSPPGAVVFTVTTNALDAQVQLVHRPRFHTHATVVS